MNIFILTIIMNATPIITMQLNSTETDAMLISRLT